MEDPNGFAENIQETLFRLIEDGQCAIFIGAGLSMPVGYPSLQDLLKLMATEAKIERLIEKELDSEWTLDFKEIKDTIGEQNFRDLLGDVFDHKKNSQKYNSILANILKIPFCAYVTTNYDPCLEFAASNLVFSEEKYSFSYPNLPHSRLQGKHIFHIHGYVDPKDPESVNSLVLSHDDYERAYEEGRQRTSSFLQTLFSELDVLFVGFGWSDFVLLNTLKKSLEIRQINEAIATRGNVPIARGRLRFALIDNETLERDRDSDNFIQQLNINPIVYNKIGNSHYQLNDLIESIQRETTNEPVHDIPSVPTNYYDLADIYQEENDE